MNRTAPTPGAGPPVPGRRLEQLAELPVTVLRGVGERSAGDLAELGVTTVFDLLTHYPRRYIDGTRMLTTDRLVEGEKATVLATVRRVSAPPARGGARGRGRRALRSPVCGPRFRYSTTAAVDHWLPG